MKRLGTKLNWTTKKTAMLLSFVSPIFLMLIGFIIIGIYPFGDRSFLSTDMYHQYMPFFSEFMRAVKSGEGLGYTWNVGMGSNFLALYVYYLASPFHWLGMVVPERFYIEFLTYLVVFKIGLCGLSSFWFFLERGRLAENARRSMEDAGEYIKPELTALLFSVFYALSGFMAAYNWNIMWIDCVVLLPLIVLGLERLVREGKPGLYCLMLGLSIYTNYYISIMICIFLVLYFMFLYFTEKRVLCGPGKGGRALAEAYLRPVGQFALYSLLAGGMAAVLLVPEACAILATDFGKSEFPAKVESYFSVLDMLSRHCISVSVEKGLDHWPNIYCGVAAFLLVPLYVFSDKIPARKRFGMMALAGFILLGFSTNALDFIWHGWNYPDSLPARQSFIYALLILTMCLEACNHLDLSRKEDKEQIIRLCLGVAVAMLFVEKFAEHEDIVAGVEWLTLLFVCFYGAVLYMAYIHKSGIRRKALVVVVLTVVLVESGVNTCCTSIANVSRSSYLEHLKDYQILAGQLEESEDGFYRVEKFTRKTKNDGTLVGYPTASVFSSTMNSYVKDLYERLGMRYSKVYYGYDGATAFTAALLNVHYVFGESDAYENTLYTIWGESGEVCLYRAENTLPFGYVAPTGYDLPEGYDASGLRLQNQMVHDLGIEEQLFVRCKEDSSGDNVFFAPDRDGIYYGIVAAGGTAKVKCVGGSAEEQQYKDLKKGGIIYLGSVNAGQAITLMNDDEDDKSPNIDVDIYRLDEQVLKQALAKLSVSGLENVSYDSDSIAGQIILKEPGRMILSVPYEKGWKVTINGEEAEPQLFGSTLMAFDLEAGEYELEMEYVPYGSSAGIVVSVVSILCFGGLMLGRRKKQGRKDAIKDVEIIEE